MIFKASLLAFALAASSANGAMIVHNDDNRGLKKMGKKTKDAKDAKSSKKSTAAPTAAPTLPPRTLPPTKECMENNECALDSCFTCRIQFDDGQEQKCNDYEGMTLLESRCECDKCVRELRFRWSESQTDYVVSTASGGTIASGTVTGETVVVIGSPGGECLDEVLTFTTGEGSNSYSFDPNTCKENPNSNPFLTNRVAENSNFYLYGYSCSEDKINNCFQRVLVDYSLENSGSEPVVVQSWKPTIFDFYEVYEQEQVEENLVVDPGAAIVETFEGEVDLCRANVIGSSRQLDFFFSIVLDPDDGYCPNVMYPYRFILGSWSDPIVD